MTENMDGISRLIRLPCANCLSTDKDNTKSILTKIPNGKLREAFFSIYGLNFQFPESEDARNLRLCPNCSNIFFQLYHLYNHFRDLTRESSVIGQANAQLASNASVVVKKEATDVGCQLQIEVTPTPNSVDASEVRQPVNNNADAGTESQVETADVGINTMDLEEANAEPVFDELELENWMPPPPVVELGNGNRHSTLSQVQIKKTRGRGRPKGSLNKTKEFNPISDSPIIVKRGRGRPRRLQVTEQHTNLGSASERTLLAGNGEVRKGRGRPRKVQTLPEEIEPPIRIENVFSTAEVQSEVNDRRLMEIRRRRLQALLNNRKQNDISVSVDLVDDVSGIINQNGKLHCSDEVTSQAEINPGTLNLLNRKRGRPRKVRIEDAGDGKAKRGRGRPPGSKMIVTGKNIKQKFHCRQCGKVADSYSNLQVHIRGAHKGFNPFPCATCSSKFSTKSGLKIHSQAVHGNLPRERLHRIGCPASIPGNLSLPKKLLTAEPSIRENKRNLDTDKKVALNSAENGFVCKTCGSDFKTYSNLDQHVRFEHRGTFAIPPTLNTCNVCGETFHSARESKVHSCHAPSQVKQQCPLCPKRFTSSTNLRVHLSDYHKQKSMPIPMVPGSKKSY